jgi:uncharacterized protein with GYD domain
MNKLISAEAEHRAQGQDLKERDEAEDRKKRNYNFVQLEKRAFKELRELAKRSASAFQLIMVMGEKMNRQNALVCSYDTLTKITGMSRATIVRAIKTLREEQWIQVIKVGSANAYVINSRVFWQSHGDKKMTSFHASIVATSDEQDEPVENWEGVKLKHFPILTHADEVLLAGDEPEPPNQDEIDFHQ